MTSRTLTWVLGLVLVSVARASVAVSTAELESKLSEHEHSDYTYEVEFHTSATLGITLDNNRKVASFVRDKDGRIGPAEKSGLIYLQDELIAVNEEELSGLSVSDVIQVLRQAANAPPPRILRFRSVDIGDRKLSTAIKREQGKLDVEYLTVQTSLGESLKLEVFAADDFGANFTCLFGKVVLPDRMDGCLEHDTDLRGNILLVKRGVCSFIHKAINAQRAGAIAVVVINNDEELFHMSQGNENLAHDIKIPAVLVSKSDGEQIVNVLSHYRVKHLDGLLHMQSETACSASIGKESAKATASQVAKVVGMPGYSADEGETCASEDRVRFMSGTICGQEGNGARGIKTRSKTEEEGCDVAFDLLCWDLGCTFSHGARQTILEMTWEVLCTMQGSEGQYRNQILLVLGGFPDSLNPSGTKVSSECTIDEAIAIARDYFKAEGLLIAAQDHRLWHVEEPEDDDAEESSDSCTASFSVGMVTNGAGQWLRQHQNGKGIAIHHNNRTQSLWNDLRPLWHHQSWPTSTRGRALLMKRLELQHREGARANKDQVPEVEKRIPPCRWTFIQEAMKRIEQQERKTQTVHSFPNGRQHIAYQQ